MELEDRIGSTVRLTEIQHMSNCMSLCNLSVIITVGRHFTWNNKQEGANRVFSRIDRVLRNAKWNDLFETAEAAYLDEATFDHCPMILRCYKAGCVKRPFRFFNMWLNANNFMELVESTWGKYVYGCHMFRIVQKLKWLKPALKALNGQATAEKQVANLYASAHKNYLSYLQHTAKIHWLKVGDENTRAFHQSIKHRRKRNKINSIQTENGDWIRDEEGINCAFTQYYDTGPRLTDAHKESLKCSFTHSDIKRVLDTIPNDKAPGMDAWPVVKDDITRAINDFFSTGKMLKEINVTSITMVPKVSVPNIVGDFIPIACCSVIYKCISKLMCEKLNVVLPDIISHNQGAFVAGRSILYNVLVCQDIVKIYRKSQKQMGCL
ncbi:uncharacterized protein [Spinacia oleracea]|uniref:Reverse transcriptase domain-containing protein n=1 Tax=Spinacia oleracea TaxID=3562 RepID=A0ABM3QXV7_SPIOL|nr:uncharacterized protein LOC130463174 [Spinacia oleracea]